MLPPDMLRRLNTAKKTGILAVSPEDVDFLLRALLPWTHPEQMFECVCGKQHLGPEDYRKVANGDIFHCDKCGVAILRVVTGYNCLVALQGEDGVNLRDVTYEYQPQG